MVLIFSACVPLLPAQDSSGGTALVPLDIFVNDTLIDNIPAAISEQIILVDNLVLVEILEPLLMESFSGNSRTVFLQAMHLRDLLFFLLEK